MYGCVSMHALSFPSWLTLWDPVDRITSGSSVCEDSPGKKTGVGCHSLFQGIFLTQGLNPCWQAGSLPPSITWVWPNVWILSINLHSNPADSETFYRLAILLHVWVGLTVHIVNGFPKLRWKIWSCKLTSTRHLSKHVFLNHRRKDPIKLVY